VGKDGLTDLRVRILFRIFLAQHELNQVRKIQFLNDGKPERIAGNSETVSPSPDVLSGIRIEGQIQVVLG